MVLEHPVLLGVEHLEQRRRWIATEVGGHLVDLVQHDDGIAGARFFHHLNHLAGQCADVGTAMAADFGFVTHAAQRHADKLAAGGLGNRHAQRGFAHAGRSDEAQDRTFGLLH